MIVVGFIAVVVVLGLFRARRRRRTKLAGLLPTAPTFTLTPPRRWSTSLRDHRL